MALNRPTIFTADQKKNDRNGNTQAPTSSGRILHRAREDLWTMTRKEESSVRSDSPCMPSAVKSVVSLVDGSNTQSDSDAAFRRRLISESR